MAIFAYGLAGILGLDLDRAVAEKVTHNAGRVYAATLHGHVDANSRPGRDMP